MNIISREIVSIHETCEYNVVDFVFRTTIDFDSLKSASTVEGVSDIRVLFMYEQNYIIIL